jgi:hypothetical protein
MVSVISDFVSLPIYRVGYFIVPVILDHLYPFMYRQLFWSFCITSDFVSMHGFCHIGSFVSFHV